MTYRIGELRYKEVIDIGSGARYGYADDLEFDENGTVTNLIIAGRPRLFGLLGREPDLVFPWSAIRRFGEDIILVDSGQHRLSASRLPSRGGRG